MVSGSLGSSLFGPVAVFAFLFFSSNLLPSSVRAAGIYGMLSGQVGGLGIDAMPATDCWRETRLKYYSIFDLKGRH